MVTGHCAAAISERSRRTAGSWNSPNPAVLVWTLPHGRSHAVTPRAVPGLTGDIRDARSAIPPRGGWLVALRELDDSDCRCAAGIDDDPAAQWHRQDRGDLAGVADGGAGHVPIVGVLVYRDRHRFAGRCQLHVVVGGAWAGASGRARNSTVSVRPSGATVGLEVAGAQAHGSHREPDGYRRSLPCIGYENLGRGTSADERKAGHHGRARRERRRDIDGAFEVGELAGTAGETTPGISIWRGGQYQRPRRHSPRPSLPLAQRLRTPAGTYVLGANT
jgi:hypothetical protein